MEEIIGIRLGTSNAYLVKGYLGYILVDAGNRGCIEKFKATLLEKSIDPQDIRLIIVTHSHHDHVGSLCDIKKLTGARVLIHKKEASILKLGKSRFSKPTGLLGKIISILMGKKASTAEFTPVYADIRIDEEYSLRDEGIDGTVIPAPGHTPGSICVVLDSGVALVGDTFTHIFPESVYPPWADDEEALMKSWRMLKKLGIKRFLPGHGSSFGPREFKKTLKKINS